MKRLTALIVCAAIVVCLCTACMARPKPAEVPVLFYYPTASFFDDSGTSDFSYNCSSKIVVSEERESFGHEKDYPYLLAQYFQGPLDQKLTSPFPMNLSVLSFTIAGNTVVIQLSKELSSLSGIDLTLACSCLAKTIYAMTGISRIQISSYESFLDGTPYVFIDALNIMDLEHIHHAPLTTRPFDEAKGN